MSQWVKVCSPNELSDGQKICTAADGIPVVVCNVEGELTAFQNHCPHAHLPLGQGDLTGKILICPFHGYAYNVVSGRNIDFEDDVPLAMMPVRTQGDAIEVQLPAPGASESNNE